MLKLNAATVVVGSLAAAALPTQLKHEAVKPSEPAAIVAAASSEVSVPEFVSAVNFGQFVQASRESASVSHDQGRVAAERLIEKFSGAAARSDKDFLHGVVENKQPSPAPNALGATAQVALANTGSEESAQADADTVPADSDPSRDAAIAAVDADPSSANGEASDIVDPKKPGADAATAVTLTRKRAAARANVNGSVRNKLGQNAPGPGSVVRLKRRQVAAADSPPPMGLLFSSATSQPSDPSEKPDSRALGGMTQSMAPLLSRCGAMTDACKANQAWCGC